MPIGDLRHLARQVEAAIASGPIAPSVAPEEIRRHLGSRYDFTKPMKLDEAISDVEEMMRSRERGLGLFGMQERLALVGGQLVIDSSPGLGTRIHARVPARPATGLA